MLSGPNLVVLVVFLGTTGLIFVLLFLFGDSPAGGPFHGSWLPWRHRRTRPSELALSALPRLGTPLLPVDQQEQAQLQQRLVQAGYYGRSALPVFLGVRVVVLACAALVSVVLLLTGWLALAPGLIVTAVLVGLALLGPGLFLDWQKKQRQAQLRRALPDVLDVITICLEAGLGLSEAIHRVSEELATAHPLLAEEMTLVEREMLLGLGAGEALRKFAARCDLPEVRDLAAVVEHSERYGVGTAAALRIEADSMRLARQQRAEELAQKAAVKVLFPTLLFIFPAIFVIVLGPAVYSIMSMFAQTQ
jgi:tight adherence protein C